jgi:hypothetical protein
MSRPCTYYGELGGFAVLQEQKSCSCDCCQRYAACAWSAVKVGSELIALLAGVAATGTAVATVLTAAGVAAVVAVGRGGDCAAEPTRPRITT